MIYQMVTLPVTLGDPDGPKWAITLSDKDVLRYTRLAVISTMRRRLSTSKYVDNATRRSQFTVTIGGPVRVWNEIICTLSTLGAIR